jgi:LacI family gluconate utilization system Gnt-I transcriptional repressor
MPASARRSRASGRVTLADAAGAAGVSAITASRALTGKRSVDPALVERARRAALEFGYAPDPAARALALRHSTHVALLLPMLSNALFVDLLEAAQQQLRAAGFQTLIGITHYDSREEEQLLREQQVHRPAGLLVTGLPGGATRRLIAASGAP